MRSKSIPALRRRAAARESSSLDSELTALYGVTTKRFNEQVKRNLRRFPADFTFQLNADELITLRSQNATLKALSCKEVNAKVRRNRERVPRGTYLRADHHGVRQLEVAICDIKFKGT